MIFFSDPAIMKLNVVLLLCFTGLVQFAVSMLLTMPHRYELVTTSMTWPAAQGYCRVKYTDLAIILSATDWIRLNKETKSKGQISWTMWVGLWNDVNSWRWSLGDLPLQSFPYTNWYPGNPIYHTGSGGCVAMDIYARWYDEPCTQLRPFACYNAAFSGPSRFIIISSPSLTWFNAQAYCRQYHTDLASSLNSSDNNIIQQMLGNNSPWIGLYRDTWKWSDGTNATNVPWAPGNPDNYWGNENCAVVYYNQFYDTPCSSTYYFICHTNFPTRSQIIRLHIDSDGSVFDTAVQSSILDQVKQTLEENGLLENTTVTWSVQPDGNIVNKIKKGQQ